MRPCVANSYLSANQVAPIPQSRRIPLSGESANLPPDSRDSVPAESNRVRELAQESKNGHLEWILVPEPHRPANRPQGRGHLPGMHLNLAKIVHGDESFFIGQNQQVAEERAWD